MKLINALYNVAHSLITVLIMFDIAELIGRDFPEAELPFFFGIGGGIVGLALGGIWEKWIEKHILRMPESKCDLINMGVSGAVGGIIAAYLTVDHTVLFILSSVSVVFVVGYFVKMFRTRNTREKLSF